MYIQCRDLKFPRAAKVTFKQEFDIEEVPLFTYTYTDKLSPVKNQNPPTKTATENSDPNTALGNICNCVYILIPRMEQTKLA